MVHYPYNLLKMLTAPLYECSSNQKTELNFALPRWHLSQQNPFLLKYSLSWHFGFSVPASLIPKCDSIAYDWLIRICGEHKIIWVKMSGEMTGYAWNDMQFILYCM